MHRIEIDRHETLRREQDLKQRGEKLGHPNWHDAKSIWERWNELHGGFALFQNGTGYFPDGATCERDPLVHPRWPYMGCGRRIDEHRRLCNIVRYHQIRLDRAIPEFDEYRQTLLMQVKHGRTPTAAEEKKLKALADAVHAIKADVKKAERAITPRKSREEVAWEKERQQELEEAKAMIERFQV